MIDLYKYHYGLLAPIMNETITKIFAKYSFPICRVTLLPILKTKKYSTDGSS